MSGFRLTIQHFKPVAKFGGADYLGYTRRHDKIKDSYCKRNNIPLLRIRYDERPILESLIDEFIKQVESDSQEYYERYNEEVKNMAAAFRYLFKLKLVG